MENMWGNRYITQHYRIWMVVVDSKTFLGTRCQLLTKYILQMRLKSQSYCVHTSPTVLKLVRMALLLSFLNHCLLGAWGFLAWNLHHSRPVEQMIRGLPI